MEGSDRGGALSLSPAVLVAASAILIISSLLLLSLSSTPPTIASGSTPEDSLSSSLGPQAATPAVNERYRDPASLLAPATGSDQISHPVSSGNREAQWAGTAITASDGISFDLHDFDAPYNADWGYWCETGITRSNAACIDCGLLSSNLTTVTHRVGSAASLKLSYTVAQTNTLASYYEHLDTSGVYLDLSHLSKYRFWVKGEGNTIGYTTTFWVRFADLNWYSGTHTITGVTGDWQEKTIDLESLRGTPGWEGINWRQMREITIIFENNRKDSGRVAHPLTGTLYFDLIGLTSPDADPTFPDPLNNFISDWGYWCETGITRSNATCADYGLLFSNVVTTPHHGDSGVALQLSYTVTQTDTLASHYEHLYSGDTFYDLSSMGEFRFWVKGKGNTVGNDTTFWVRFADKDWHTGFYTITGVTGDWQEKTIDLESLKNTPDWQDIDWRQMREFTIIFENNRDGSGRVVHPLTGTLYFDDLAFVDVETNINTDDQFLELLERRAFRYFWEYADPTTGLIRETAADPNMSSIATVGFGLTSICTAKERGWITHEEAYNRVLTTLNSFYDDGSPGDLVVSGTHGLFYHFVNIHEGTPMLLEVDGVSTIDTALLMAGVLSVKQCFTETEITTLATAIYEAAEWDWFFHPTSGTLTMCWTPYDEYPYQCWTDVGQRGDSRVWHWEGYNEAMILYLLAIGSPTHPISATSWISWANTYRWGAYYGYPVLVHAPSPLFGHQYSHAWVDFRGKRDDYANYFRNSRYATLAHHDYCLDVWYPGRDLWGITSSHGPIAGTCSGKTYRIIGYPPDHGNNDGTIAPTAAGGSIVFTPPESISTLRYMYDEYHQRLWGLYGLKDSLNARCEPDWFDNDYIGIDVGAMLLMIENYRSNQIWDTFMRNPEITQAMEAVGFSPDQTKEPSWFYYREAEQYDSISGSGIAVEHHLTAWEEHTLQISTTVGNSAVYTISVDDHEDTSMFFEVRYSDDVAGNIIDVHLDDDPKGSFTTTRFGGWESFCWHDEKINLGIVTSGTHTIKLEVAEGGGGSWGVNLDVFRLYTALDVAKQADPNPVDSGAQLTYAIAITNTSDMTLTTTVTDVLPAQVTPSGLLTWTASITAPGGVWTEQFTVTVNAGYAGVLTNVVQVTTAEGPAGIYTATSLSLTPHLEVAKQATPDPVPAGAPLTYTLTVANTGGADATGMVITDALPAGASYVGCSGGTCGENNGMVTWSDLTAPANDTIDVTLVVTACAGPLVNSAYRVASCAQGVGSPWGTPTTTTVQAQPLVASFTASASVVCVGDVIAFTNTSVGATSYQWDFGDGPGSTAVHPTHQYTSSGAFTVFLTATNACSSATYLDTITVYDSPTAAFTHSNGLVCVGETVFFTNTSTGATTYQWGFGDASGSPDEHPTHVYTSAGMYTVTLTASNPGCADDATAVITVSPDPIASFIPSATTICSSGTVTFTNTSTYATSYEWDFGDGNGSTNAHPSHQYDSPGTYTVTLQASNVCGDDRHQEIITVRRCNIYLPLALKGCQNSK